MKGTIPLIGKEEMPPNTHYKSTNDSSVVVTNTVPTAGRDQ